MQKHIQLKKSFIYIKNKELLIKFNYFWKHQFQIKEETV